MATFGKRLKNATKSILLTLFGFISWHFVFLYLLICLPFSVYRFLITKLVAPIWTRLRYLDKEDGRLGKPVTLQGTAHGSEFWGSRKTKPVRCVIVVTFVFEGHISSAEFRAALQEKWMNAVDSLGNFKYPEFKQYISSFLGFMFWRNCKNYNLADNFQTHLLPEDYDDKEAEAFVNNLIETLVNKPFPVGKSPWELHLIRNYRNTGISGKYGKKLSVVALRFHHGMADGYAVMYTVAGVLYGVPMHVETKSSSEKPLQQKQLPRKRKNVCKDIVSLLTIPARLSYDLGNILALNFRRKTTWQISYSNKSYKQYFDRSTRIPISRVKEIKNKLGVSFNSVVFSSVAGGFARQLHNTGKSGVWKNFPVATFLPLPGHPEKLRNHFTGTSIDLPVHPELHPVARLKQCEKRLQDAKKSVMPLVMGRAIMPALLTQVAPLARLTTRNRFLPCGLSCFKASHLGDWYFNGRKGRTCEYIVGGYLGICGITISALSCPDYLTITVTAESTVVSRDELRQLLSWIEEEIDVLGAIPELSNNRSNKELVV